MDTDEIEQRRTQSRTVRKGKDARRAAKDGKKKKTWR
jgi:hypothetical protein